MRRSAHAAILAVLLAALLRANCGTSQNDASVGPDLIPNVSPDEPGERYEPPIPIDANFATRTSGAAPLAVFFDAIKTEMPPWSPDVAQPGEGADFAAWHYAWDFGDPSSGTWATDGKSRNTAVGHIAAHIFEIPGTYIVRLTLTRPDGLQQQYAQDITVEAFSGPTYYVSSSSGSDSSDGLSMSTPLASLSAGMSRLGANTRLLLKRGDTWTLSTDLIPDVAGPVMIGAYGSGERPVIVMTVEENVVTMLDAAVDWRFVDLDLRKPGTTADEGVAILHPKTNCLVLRCRFEGFSGGLAHYDKTASESFGVAECEFAGQYNNNIYVAPDDGSPPCTRMFVLGCSLGFTVDQHLVRLHTDKSLLSHNIFQQCPACVHHLKLAAAPQLLPERPYKNNYSLVSDNLFINPGECAWILSLGPQDLDTQALVENVIIERNLFDVPGKVAIESRGANGVTIRNNVFRNCREVITIGDGVAGFSVWRDWGIYNNTYWTSAQEGFFLNLGAQPVNWKLRNNICDIPNATNEAYVVWTNVDGFSIFGLDCNHNLYNIPRIDYWFETSSLQTFVQWKQLATDTDSISGPPGFVDASGGNFQLTAGSIAADMGVSLPQVREDFTGAPRPQGEAYDIGAFER